MSLSSGTLRHVALGKFVSPGSFRNVVEKYLAYAQGSALVVTLGSSFEHTGSLYFESPTLRFTTEAAFKSLGLFHAVAERECDLGFREYFAPTSFTVHVISSGTAAPLSRLPGLFNSTDRALGIPPLVQSKFATAVALAGEEWFEDGVESRFSRTLSTLLYAYGDAAVAAVERYLGSRDINIEVAVEAAQWLGDVDHSASSSYRRTLLEKTLMYAPTARLRHGAATGLATMDDPSSYSVVLEALGRESNRGLRQLLQLVADQLGRTRACPSL